MSVKHLVVIGADWCGDCHRARRILDENQIPYEWIEIDKDKEAEKFVLQINKGLRIIPTILFDDGSTLVEPSNSALAAKLGLLNQIYG